MKIISGSSSRAAKSHNSLSTKAKAGLIGGIAAGVIVLAAAGVGFGMVSKVSRLDTIYPGVTINGTDVSGMTRAEAIAALGNPIPDGLTADLTLPDGTVLSVTPAQAGIATDTEHLVDMAMDFGRGGSPVANAVAYYKAENTLDMADDIYSDFDDSAIRTLVTDAVSKYNTLHDAKDCVTEEKRIVLVKGAGIPALKADELIKKLTDGLKEAVSTGKSWSEVMPAVNAKDPDWKALYDSIFKEPVSASYDKSKGEVVEGTAGISFDMDKAKQAYQAAKKGDQVVVDLVFTEPKISAAQLREVLFRDELYRCTTSYASSSDNRIHNVKLAAAAIDGTILNPGETFSYNDLVGERSEARGFKEGLSYIGGKAVPDIGGGICQVSSSVYACCIYTDMEIVERYNHMFTVSYLPIGIDATVAWGSLDFRFTNNKDYPIKIVTSATSSSLEVAFYGTKTDDTYIEIDSTIVETVPFNTVRKTDSKLGPGESKIDTYGHEGYIVDTYRSFYEADGTLIRREYLDRSDYSTQDRIILEGPAASSGGSSSGSSSSGGSESVAPPVEEEPGESESGGSESGGSESGGSESGGYESGEGESGGSEGESGGEEGGEYESGEE